jgi:ribonuclease-3
VTERRSGTRKSGKQAPEGAEGQGKQAEVGDLENRLGYAFRKPALLQNALIHKSYVNEQRLSHVAANERLEFLGDAVLELVVSQTLMERYPAYTEGDLSKLRASIVNEQGLARLARKLGLGGFLFLGKGEERSGGRDKSSILADGYEAVLAAVYLDGGLPAAEAMVKSHFQGAMRRKLAVGSDRDFKTVLQEHCQAKFQTAPRYRLVSTAGPDHRKEFTVEVNVNGKWVTRGRGLTKKQAEQRAAALAYKKITGGGKTGDEGPVARERSRKRR